MDVQDSPTSTAAAQIWNTAANNTAGHTGLIIKMGTAGIGTNPNANDAFLLFLNGAGHRDGQIIGNGNAVTYQTGGADYSEYFAVDPSVLPANYTQTDRDALFSVGTLICQGSNGVVPCGTANAKGILGIISNNAGFVGAEDGPNKVLVGMVGQLVVKVSSVNGDIKNGDPLTFSPFSGVAMKATKAGEIVGRALADYSNTDKTATGTILTSVNANWYDPDVYLSDTGNIDLFEKPNAPLIDGTSLFGVTNNGQNVQKVGVFSDAVVGNLKTGSINAQQLTLGGTDLNNKLLGLDNVASISAGLVNPVAELQSQMQSLSDRIASVEAKLNATDSAMFTNNLGNFTASTGAELSLDKLNVNSSIISDSLNVLSYATINELSVTGSIRTGVLTINGQSGTGGASISTLNGDLKLQDQGFGGIDILNGKVTIDTTGNIQSAGNITAKKFNVDTSDVSAASAGTGTITAGTNSTIINTSAVTSNSLIQVTFTSDYGPATRYWIKTKTAGQSFTIQLDQPVLTNAKFNWWIVN